MLAAALASEGMQVNPIDPRDLATLPWSNRLHILSYLAAPDEARLQQASLAWSSRAVARPWGGFRVKGF